MRGRALPPVHSPRLTLILIECIPSSNPDTMYGELPVAIVILHEIVNAYITIDIYG